MSYARSPQFDQQDLAEAGIYTDIGPMSVYRRVLVVWDKDHDARILEWIDSLPKHVRRQLLAAHEHEGVLNLLWAAGAGPPTEFARHQTIDVAEDNWYIDGSVCASRHLT